jgi:hypothetical protein
MEMSVDEIALTLPSDDAFHGVAHLVLGGVATRHDLTVETLEDLTLALDTVLDCCGDRSDDVTVVARVADDSAVIEIGPFDGGDIEPILERTSAAALDASRILDTVADAVEVVERDGRNWVRMTKRVERVTEDER